MKSYQGKIDASPAELKKEAKEMNKLIHAAAGGQMRTELPMVDPKNQVMNDLLRNPQAAATNSQTLNDASDNADPISRVAGNAGSGTGTRLPAAKLPLTFNEALREVLELRKKLGAGDIDLSIKGR